TALPAVRRSEILASDDIHELEEYLAVLSELASEAEAFGTRPNGFDRLVHFKPLWAHLVRPARPATLRTSPPQIFELHRSIPRSGNKVSLLILRKLSLPHGYPRYNATRITLNPI